MEDLKKKIQDQIIESSKSKDDMTRDTLRMILAVVLSKEKEKRYKVSKQKPEAKEHDLVKESVLINEEIIDIISSEIKKRKEAIALYEKGGRQELADKEKAEIEVLKKYLPEQISEEELRKIIKDAIDKVGAKEMKDMGKVMAELMSKVKGKADGSEISKIAKELMEKGA